MANEYEVIKDQQLTLDNAKNMNFINVVDMLGSHSTKLLWGQGFKATLLTNDNKIDEEETEYTNKLLKKVGFNDLVLQNEWGMSVYGRMINTIDLSKTGRINIGQADPNYYNQIGRVYFVNQTMAVVWKKFVYDKTQFRVKEYWDTKQVRREFWYGDQQLSLFEFQEAVPEDLQLPEVYEHNLGILPIHEFQNLRKPIFNANTYQYSMLADWYSAKNMVLGVNQLLRAKYIETYLNVSRVFGTFDRTQLKQMVKRGIAPSMAAAHQMFIEAESNSPKGDNKRVEIQQANPALAVYDESIEKEIKRIFNVAGYTYMTGEESLDTNASTLFSKGKDIETTKYKRSIRQRDYEDFIKKLLIVDGKYTADQWDDINIVFEINENIVQSPEGVINAQMELVNAGMITKAVALQKILDLSVEEEAQAMVDKAQEELTKENEADMKMAMEYQNEETKGIDDNEVNDKEQDGVE